MQARIKQINERLEKLKYLDSRREKNLEVIKIRLREIEVRKQSESTQMKAEQHILITKN